MEVFWAVWKGNLWGMGGDDKKEGNKKEKDLYYGLLLLFLEDFRVFGSSVTELILVFFSLLKFLGIPIFL